MSYHRERGEQLARERRELRAEIDRLDQRGVKENSRGSEKLHDLVTVITGGDYAIARAVAVCFAREGADVALVYLSGHEQAKETKHAVEGEQRRAILLCGDVANSSFCQESVNRCIEEFGRIDILVNIAALQNEADPMESVSKDRFDRVMKTALDGYSHMAKAALPHLKNGASIINTAPVTGLFGEKSLLDTSPTQGGIHAFTGALAQDLAKRGIRVNAVAPGAIWTPLNSGDPEVGSKGSKVSLAHLEEVSMVYVFLASPSCSSEISGEVLGVIGGVLRG